MLWNDHSKDNLGDHAILNPSGYSWINYSSGEIEEKLVKRYFSMMRAPAGTAIHRVAQICIDRKMRLPKQINNVIKMVQLCMSGGNEFSNELINFIPNLPEHVFRTLILYVDDCIGFGMETEKSLVYSPSCFGHADAISFDGNILRISDLKTGDGPTHMEQLFIYDALFCLEYHFKPNQIRIENRLYQLGEIQEVLEVPTELVLEYMQTIMTQSKFLDKLRGKE